MKSNSSLARGHPLLTQPPSPAELEPIYPALLGLSPIWQSWLGLTIIVLV